MDPSKNVLGRELASCCRDPLTGFFRTGSCDTGPEDHGRHVICGHLTEEFLLFSKERGNDLMTPRPEWGFPGLKDGDRWCLCAMRWREALEAGKACPVYLEATHASALEYVRLEDLRAHALDASDDPHAEPPASPN